MVEGGRKLSKWLSISTQSQTSNKPAHRDNDRPRSRDKYRDDNHDWEDDYDRDDDYRCDDDYWRD